MDNIATEDTNINELMNPVRNVEQILLRFTELKYTKEKNMIHCILCVSDVESKSELKVTGII